MLVVTLSFPFDMNPVSCSEVVLLRGFVVLSFRRRHALRSTSERAAGREDHSGYWLGPLAAASASFILFPISAFTASRLKLAPRCIGG